mgnify:CR=1 FL=1
MATLIDRVRGNTGSSTSISSDQEVLDHLQSGAKYVLNSLPINVIQMFGTLTTTVATDTGVSCSDKYRVLSVRRGDFECEPAPLEQYYAYSTALSVTSLNQRSTIFPVYFKRDGVIYPKPAPTTSVNGTVTYIGLPTFDEDTSTHLYNELDNPMVLYASGLDALQITRYWVNLGLIEAQGSTGEARDALNKAKNLIDNSTALSNGNDAEFYLNEEDSEMIQSNISIAAQELKRASIEKIVPTQIVQATNQYLQMSQSYFQRADQELLMYARAKGADLGGGDKQ